MLKLQVENFQMEDQSEQKSNLTQLTCGSVRKGDYQDRSEHNMKTKQYGCHAHVMLLSMHSNIISIIPEFHGEHLVLIFIVQCCIPSGELKEVGQTTV